MRKWWGVLTALGLAGCQTVAPPPTASGKPEVVIANVSPEKVKPILVNRMVNVGYRITKDTSYELTFDKPVENILAAALLGSKYDPTPNARVSYMFAQVGNDTRIVADMAIITNPGSAFERRMEMNQGVDAHDMHAGLQQVKAELDPSSPQSVARQNGIVLGVNVVTPQRARAAGMTGGPDNGLYVVMVTPGSLAEAAGIKKGDVILGYGGGATNTLDQLAAAQAKTKPGSTVKLTIQRQAGEQADLSITFPGQAKPVAAPKKKLSA